MNKFKKLLKLVIICFLGFSSTCIAMDAQDDGRDPRSPHHKPSPSKNSAIDDLSAQLAASHMSAPLTQPQSLQFKVNLCRIRGKSVVDWYFSKSAVLKCSDVVLSHPDDQSIFGESSHLTQMDRFLCDPIHKDWRRNHLAVKLFVVVDDKIQGKKRYIEGSLLVESCDNGDHKSFEFSAKPGDVALGERKVANFVSFPVSDEFAASMNGQGYRPIYKEELRPIFDSDKHGDRLALDTIRTNIDLPFSLVRKSGHREDLLILCMGVKYFSSYDACNSCFDTIYNTRAGLQTNVSAFAKMGNYGTPLTEIPFYSIFYASRPYKETTYNVYWEYPVDKKIYGPVIVSDYEKVYGIPKYYFKEPQILPQQRDVFARRSTRQLNLLTETNEIPQTMIWNHVSSFEIDGVPLSYQ